MSAAGTEVYADVAACSGSCPEQHTESDVQNEAFEVSTIILLYAQQQHDASRPHILSKATYLCTADSLQSSSRSDGSSTTAAKISLC